MLDTTTTSKIIKEARIHANLTQEQLAEKLFVSKQAVSNWERGENLPDEDVREKIEEILGVKLRKESMINYHYKPFLKQMPELKSLGEIDQIEELIAAVIKIVDSLSIDSYEHTIKRMLYLTLAVILGKELYYDDHCKKYYSDCTFDWNTTASDLQSLVSNADDWVLGERDYPFRTKNLLSRKVEIIVFDMGYELFEDFDESGYRNGFVQQIGRYGESCGYDLLDLLPETNTDLMVIYKSAIYDIADILFELYPEE